MSRTTAIPWSLTMVVASVLFATMGAAQTPAPGFRLFGPFLGTDTHLVDTNGVIVQTWPSAYQPRHGVYMLDDGSLLRMYQSPNAQSFLLEGGGLERLALDGTVLWDFRYDGPGFICHHDLAPMANGNVLMIAYDELTPAQALALGRNPALNQGPIFRPGHIVEVQPTGPTSGNIVWEWHVTDHLIQDFDPTKANFGVVGNHPELVDLNYPPVITPFFDWNHCNGIDYDPVNDLIVISSREQSEIWILDHSTTTAEASGHTGGNRGRGGDLLYRWGNPEAYRAGTPADRQLFHQHNPTFIKPGYRGEGHILLFNNGASGGSAACEIVLPQDATGNLLFGPGNTFGPAGPVWTYARGFHSDFTSSAERLPNGNTLICSAGNTRVFEVTYDETLNQPPSGPPAPGKESREVWSYTLGAFMFHAHYYERNLWADEETVSSASGGTIGFDLIAGSEHAGRSYLVLGSTSGTSPGIPLGSLLLPLNFDGYTNSTLLFPNAPPFIQTLGVLDGIGRGQAALALTPSLIPASVIGTVFHHAFIVFGGAGALPVLAVSNAVPLTVVP